jgi:hypothetical protein
VIALVSVAFAIAWGCLLLGLIATAVLAFRFSGKLKREKTALLGRVAMMYSWPYHVLRPSTWSCSSDRRLAGLARGSLLLGAVVLVLVLLLLISVDPIGR